MRRWVLLIGLAAVLSWGCDRDMVGHSLDAAEALMEEHPDSALTILSGVDGKGLTGETQARHALLLSQAYDKNYIDLTNDSLISIAVEFYSRSDDRRRRMLAYHYHAVVNFNNRHLETGLRSALKAHDIAVELNDAVSLTLIEGIIGAIYTDSRSLKMAYEWNIRALENAKITQNKQWQNTLYFNIADNLHLLQRFKESIAYLDSASMLCDSPNLNILELQYLSHYHMGHYDIADSINTQIIQNGFNPPLRVIICQAELNPYNALESLNNYAIQNDLTMYAMDSDFAYAMAYLRIGDINSAIESLRRHILRYNDVFSALNTYMLDRVQHEHDVEITHEQAESARYYRRVSLITILILSLVITLGILIITRFRNRQKMQRLQFERNLVIIESEYNFIKSQLEHLNDKISEKQRRIVNLEEEVYNANTSTVSSLQSQIQAGKIAAQELFLCKYSWIEKLGNIYLDAEASKNTTADRAIRDIKKNLDTVKTKQFIPSLVNVINQYRNNILERVEAECPSILKSELDILALLCANLSPRIISFILSIKLQSIYNAKSTIKRKITAESPSLLSEMSDVFGG